MDAQENPFPYWILSRFSPDELNGHSVRVLDRNGITREGRMKVSEALMGRVLVTIEYNASPYPVLVVPASILVTQEQFDAWLTDREHYVFNAVATS
jgi:hypothetical protein